MKFNIPIVLFAGGKSSRMGRDKALLPFNTYNTLSQFQYEKYKKLFNRAYLSAKDNKFDFDAEIIFDKYKDFSPLIGIISAFETLKYDEIFILSIDTPFISKEIIYELIKNKEGYDVIAAQTKDGKQPLCGIYKRSVLEVALLHQQNNNHRMGSLLNSVNTKFLFFDDTNSFTNLNYPKEYQEALKRVT
jgi:molybdopterin-guanine dinucleotide biosynthesis protein A